MAQFTLIWDNDVVEANPNAISQRALYRQRSLGGVFVSTGFTPANNMAKSVSSTDTPILTNNVVYEFKVQTICTENGPTDNDNGVQEMIGFSCIVPILSKTASTANITIDVSTTDITKARLTLKRSSDNAVITQVTALNVAGLIQHLASGVAPSTAYYWQVELYATVQGAELISSAVSQIGSVCGPYAFTTDAPATCDPLIFVAVSSVEIA